MRTGRNCHERGSAMVVMLIVLVGLGTIAGLTVLSVQGGSATTNNQRFNAIAVYAAESGAAAAMDYLRKNVVASPTYFSADVEPNNLNPVPPVGIAGNTIASGVGGNILSVDQRSWYTVVILNNRSDPGYLAGDDNDGIVTIHVTGHGPNGAVAELEWEVRSSGTVNDPLTLLGWHQTL